MQLTNLVSVHFSNCKILVFDKMKATIEDGSAIVLAELQKLGIKSQEGNLGSFRPIMPEFNKDHSILKDTQGGIGIAVKGQNYNGFVSIDLDKDDQFRVIFAKDFKLKDVVRVVDHVKKKDLGNEIGWYNLKITLQKGKKYLLNDGREIILTRYASANDLSGKLVKDAKKEGAEEFCFTKNEIVKQIK